MKHKIKVLSLRTITAILAYCVLNPVHAAGPLAVCTSGQPFLWDNGGQGIVYNLDQGDLGPVDAASAAGLIGDAFDSRGDRRVNGYVGGLDLDAAPSDFGVFDDAHVRR